MFRILAILVFSMSFLFAEIGKISAIIGDASLTRDSKSLKLFVGTEIEKNDIIKTSSNSKLQIIFKDNTIVTLGKNSALNIEEYFYDKNQPKKSKTELNFFKGAFKTITGQIGKINKEKFKLKTKTATIGIRGTVILGNQNSIACIQGEVVVENLGKTVVLRPNEFTKTSLNKEPTAPEQMSTESLQDLENELNSQNQDSVDDNDTLENENNEDESNNTNISIAPEDDNVIKNNEIAENSVLEANEDTNDEINSVKSENINLKKRLTGLVKGGTTGSSSTDFWEENRNSAFDATVNYTETDVEISYDDNFDKITSSTNDKIDATGSIEFDKVFSTDSYDGEISDLNVTLPFNNDGITGSYKLFSDNRGEVFLGYVEDSTSLSELFMIGTSSGNINDSKIYVWRDYSNLNIEKVTSTGALTTSFTNNTLGTAQDYYFYNPLNSSFTSYETSFLQDGASQFLSKTNITSATDIVSYKSDFTIASDGTISSGDYLFESGIGSLKLLGSSLQGLAFEESIEQFSDYTESSSTTSQTEEFISTNYLESDISMTTDTISDKTLKGFTSALYYDANNSSTFQVFNDTTLSNFELNIADGNSTSLTGGINSSKFNIVFDSKVNDNDFYYINQDLFGTKFEENSTYQGTSTSDMIDDTGYLISVHDGGLDSNDNPIFLDDDSSWGYWTASFNDGTNSQYVDTSSPWVAGVINTTKINELLSSGTDVTYSFKGQVLGNVKLSGGGIENILVNDDNIVNLSFDLGSTNSLTSGTIGFKTNSGASWDLGLNSSSVSSSDGSFSTSFSSGGTGSLTGQIYADDSIESVGGIFEATNSGDVASGVFKATKQ